MSLLTMLLIIFLVLAIAGAGWGHAQYGFAGWSPAVVILLVLLVAYFTGHLR